MYFFYKNTRMSNDKNYKVILEVKLSDPCRNGINRFSFTADIYKLNPKTNRFHHSQSGSLFKKNSIIEEIFPEILKFLPLNGADEQGRPIYYIENAVYFFKTEGIKKGSDYLNIDEETASKIWDRIKTLDDSDRKAFNKNVEKVYDDFGLFDKWKRLADSCIEYFTKHVTDGELL